MSDHPPQVAGSVCRAEPIASLMPHLAVLHRVAERILGCRDLARDAVQEALVTYWREQPAHGHERAWLIRTVIHRSLHERRAQARRRRWESDAVRDAASDCPLCSPPDHELERRELAASLDAALRALPEEHRTVFLLRELHGLEYDAIALRLSIPVGTVRSRLSRARCALRVALRRNVLAGGGP
ncbi:sigma-70 family RNA polymerase sigma factor [Candidatus Binatia bacterium]|jgi:RNA polymerase sigma-70 factor (ECF subfamily)|nr:sigma-70 family RNA polymerase sigma factor [Candidatus Binatia bacterium]